jgi:hypothetical protein
MGAGGIDLRTFDTCARSTAVIVRMRILLRLKSKVSAGQHDSLIAAITGQAPYPARYVTPSRAKQRIKFSLYLDTGAIP